MRDGVGHTLAICRAAASSMPQTGPGQCPHELSWSPYERTERERLVVLLIDHRAVTWNAIERASRMSDALCGRLHVVLAIPRETTGTAPTLILGDVTERLRARAPRGGFELEVTHESIAEHGFEVAREESAALVVVDAHFGAKQACHLADRLGVPVLVARDFRSGGEWIAASDLRHLRLPVLATARDLAHAVDREVLYFHNVKPLRMFVGDPMAGPASYAGMFDLQDDVVAAKRARLEHLAYVDRSHGLVTLAANTTEALLDLARDRDADMIVVGHRPRTWFSRMFARGTTERLVARSRRSVMVVPLVNGFSPC